MGYAPAVGQAFAGQAFSPDSAAFVRHNGLTCGIAPMAHADLHRLTLPHLLRHLHPDGARVLDLGAGTGGMSQLLHSAGFDVEACDLDPSLFQLPTMRCKQADFADPLPYDDATFDGIVCVEVLEHVDGHERLFREVERILKPGGVFLFTTPNIMSIKSRLNFLWTGFQNSFYPLNLDEQSPQQWHISGFGGNRYRFVLGLAGLDLREIRCDKFSRSSVAFAWLLPLIWLRSWLRHGHAPGAKLNNSLPALFGRTMIGVARKPRRPCATARGESVRFATSATTACRPADDRPLVASSASHDSDLHQTAASSRTRPSPQGSHKLTVIITCKNERDHIDACIHSARQIADEVLVADSGSTDGTLEIARSLGCQIIEREYGTAGDFKNWAIPQAAHEWIFILDADERITPALAVEIRRELAAPRHNGYWIYRRNHFLGHPIRFGPWKNDRVLRLFRRDLGRYVGPTDHAEIKLSRGRVGRLRSPMTHYTCTSYAQYLPKLERYAEVQAYIWHRAGRRTDPANLLFRFPLRFLQGYVWRLGFLDGAAGLQVCVLVAYQSFLKHACLWQIECAREWRDVEDKNEETRRAA